VSSSGSGVAVGVGLRPGGGLVVVSVVAQAAVQDADESVGQGAQGLVVGVAAGAVSVVLAAGIG
jgi:hypothetical protein